MKTLKSLFSPLLVLGFLLPAVLSAQLVDTVWANRWTGPADNSDWAYAIALDDSCNVYVTGKTEYAATHDDWTTIKYYPDGDTAWVRHFASPGTPNERANAITIGPSDNIYITGYTMSSGAGDYLTIKYKPDGDTAWTRRYNGTGDGYDFARWVAVDDQENVYVTGYSRTLTSYPSDIVTIKYDSSGTQLWVAELDGPGNAGDQANKVITDNNGYVYVAGYVNPYSSGNFYDYATIKYDAVTGDTMWVRTYNGPADSFDVARDIAVDASGNVYVTGSSRGSGTSSDMVTLKYDSTGYLEWVARYDNPDTSGADGGYGIKVDGAGNIYVAGQSQGLGTGTDFVLIKYSPDSTQQWVARYNGPANGLDRPSDEVGGKCMAIDQSANIYVTGVTWTDTTYNDYITIMYDSAGVEQWIVGYDGYDTLDYALAIAVDDSGDVCVTGRSLGLTTYLDWATVKYHSTVGIAENKRIAADLPWLEIYPNPFKIATTVRYALRNEGKVSLKIYDATGRLVKTLVNKHQSSNTYSVIWNATDNNNNRVAPGVYFYVLNTAGQTTQQKMVLVK